MPRPYQAILFDMDGVLINSEPLHARAKRTVFERYGLDVPESVYDFVKGKTDEGIFTYIRDTYGHDGLDIDEMIAAKHTAYEELLSSLEMVPGALDFVRAARRTYRVALTTSATQRNQLLAFELFHLDDLFEAIVTAADVERGKPHPDPYRVTAERLGVSPEQCLVIEDAVNGIQSALAAGCDAAGITTSFTAEELRDAGATVVAADFDELAEWLRE